MDRRNFLNPRRFAKAAIQVADTLDELTSVSLEEDPLEECAYLNFTRRAMATNFGISIPFATPNASEAAMAALDEIDRLEEQLTVYQEESEVSQLNRQAFHQPVTVESDLFQLIASADRIYQETEGAFDISTGALTKAWGFYRRCGRVPSDAEQREVIRRVGMQHIVLDNDQESVGYLREGLEINFGSIGKGYALDRATKTIHDFQIRSALLHGGKSSVFGIGSQPGSDAGWPINITHPWDKDRPIAQVRLRNRGLATSAATFQHLEHNGRKLGHILDPRTGWPAEGMASVSVVAPTSAEADALATAFFILGVEKTKEYCLEHPQVGAILLAEDEKVPVVFGLTKDDFSLYPGKAQGNPRQN